MLNGFPSECRPIEGAQAEDPAESIERYHPIALVNRLDLRDTENFSDCGEYRIIYGRDVRNRNFIIFEAQMPNPLPGNPAGCLAIAKFWDGLVNIEDANKRAQLLRSFYFQGIPTEKVPPVIDRRNYAEGTGQIRTNMFMGSTSWNLKEFKVAVDSRGDSVIKPVSVKNSPPASLFFGDATDPRAIEFQKEFVANLDNLLKDVNNFNLTVRNDVYNNGQNHASGLDANETNFGATFFKPSHNTDFKNKLIDALAVRGNPLTPEQVINRARVMTCAGCHQPNELMEPNALGPGINWPGTTGFVHVLEIAEETPSGRAFRLSPALRDLFLPARLAHLRAYIANPTGVAKARSFSAPDASRSAESESLNTSAKFGKRSG
jgi:hypothetical protein